MQPGKESQWSAAEGDRALGRWLRNGCRPRDTSPPSPSSPALSRPPPWESPPATRSSLGDCCKGRRRRGLVPGVLPQEAWSSPWGEQVQVEQREKGDEAEPQCPHPHNGGAYLLCRLGVGWGGGFGETAWGKHLTQSQARRHSVNDRSSSSLPSQGRRDKQGHFFRRERRRNPRGGIWPRKLPTGSYLRCHRRLVGAPHVDSVSPASGRPALPARCCPLPGPRACAACVPAASLSPPSVFYSPCPAVCGALLI